MNETNTSCRFADVARACPTQAYEADIHYSTTYVLARAVGWTDDAMNATLAGPPNYHAQKVKVQLSHWRQVLALPLMSRLGP